MKSSHKGFTLVELLIVIALLGALVIGLLAALDPIEQIRRGQDTGIRNTSSEFFQAVNRYYTNKGAFPWSANITTPDSAYNRGADVTALIDAGELKSNFYQKAGSSTLSRIYINSPTATDISVCFQPVSKGMQEDPATIYSSDASTTNMANCKSQTTGTAATNCYICFR